MSALRRFSSAPRRLDDTAIQSSREAVEFIRDHRNRPSFLYYPTSNIQWPRTPYERYRGERRAGFYGDFVVEFDRGLARSYPA